MKVFKPLTLFRLSFTAIAVATGLCIALPTSAAVSSPSPVPVFIVSQPLKDSLRALSERFGQSFVTDAAVDMSIRAPAVNGQFTLPQALAALLHPAGLQYQITADGIVISPADELLPQAPIEEVAVTGLRASLDVSRQRKRENHVISDVIASNDIASYPDRNLAESMQRIPGMSITREAGEGRQIMLRGLNPDFTLVTLNGMTVLANNDSPMDSRLQKQRDRSFDLNLFATDLFSEIQVLKTYDAELPTGGMAGIVALKTAHPFDHPGLHWNLSAQTGDNQFTDALSKRVSAMVSNTRGHWGALFSVAYGTRFYQEMGANTFRWRSIPPDGADTSALPTALANAWQNGELTIPRGNRYSVWQSDMDRAGVGASIEYKTDFAHVTLDWLHGRLAGERYEYHLYPRGFNSTPVIEGETRIVDAAVNDQNELIYAAYEQAQVGTESRYQQVATIYNQWVMNVEHHWAQSLTGSGVIGWELARYDMPRSNKAYMEGETDITVDYRQDARFADITYLDDLTQPTFWQMKELDAEAYFAATDFFNARYTLAYKPTDNTIWKTGIELVHFRNQTDFYDIQDLLSADWASGQRDSTVPESYSTPLTAHPKLNWLTLNTNAIFGYFGLPNEVSALKGTHAAAESEHSTEQDDIIEQRLALYSSFSADWGNWLLDAGLRIESEQTRISDSDSEFARNRTLRHTHWLPAVNLRYRLATDNTLRLSVSKTLGRPQLDDLAAAVRYDSEENTLYGYNDSLNPYSAYNIDVAWERYLSDMNRFAVSAFTKYLDDYIVYVSDNLLISRLPEYEDLLALSASDSVTLVSAQNAQQTWLYGVEASVQLETPWPWSPQYHLGVVGNVSYTQGDLTYHNANTGEALSVKSLPFLSPWLANITAYWESYDLSIRLSATYRDDYLARVDSQTLQDEDETGFEESVYVDAVIAWYVADNWELRLEATNLTNQREIQYSDSSHRPYNTTLSGRDYYVGVTYRF
ncbi:hypothetical protein BFC18_02730 [Alteromonas confluentis]|uniref:Secretin/TonB short N-terminal domain-containing protein n=1 Tax=Alteromonas confluentis TaxID=1656094 RepID=A0A1E7ZG95_9ALTE|nr:hypothetical protein BFC18_02730 [Alteromonas confluentis]